jgi:signal transduction histidine kinase
MFQFFKYSKDFWGRIIDIGIVDSLSFAERKKIHLLNGLAWVGGIGTSIYMIIMYLNNPADKKIIETDPFYYLNFILIATFLLVLYLNHLRLYNWSRALGLVVALLFYTYVGFQSAKPYEGELFVLLFAVGIFALFNQAKFIFPIFLLAFACFIALIINIALKNNEDFGYIIEAGVYIRIITLFIFLFFVLNMFRTEHLTYQKEIEQKNQVLQEQQNELLSQSELLEEQKTELIRLNQTKDKLFSIIGHDLRTPIGGLKSFVDFINEGNLSSEEFAVFSEELKKNIDNVYTMLETLLEWSQAQIKGIELNFTYLNIKELANEKIALFSELAKGKQLILKNDICTDIFAYADANHLRLVLRNLLSNAIKFTPNQGEINISAKEHEGEVIICVQDTGIGMGTEQVNRLFQKNIIYSQKGTEGERGVGLGLWLVKESVETNQGQIWVESKVGKGSKFYFTLKKYA